MDQLPLHTASNRPPPPRHKSTFNLPILQKAGDAYKLWYALLQHFPRIARFTLGEKIDGLFLETVELILLAGYSTKNKKFEVVQKAATRLDALKFFLEMAWQLKALDNKKYIRISEPLAEVGKMLGGWKKQLQNDTPLE